MAKLKVFKSNIPSSKYIFKNGKEGHFVGGKYLTDVKSEIEELNEEVTLKHPHIYIDSEEAEIDSAAQDPMAALRDKFFKEFTAAQAKAVDKKNDMGVSSISKRLEGIANSSTIAEGAAGSTGAVNAATAQAAQK